MLRITGLILSAVVAFTTAVAPSAAQYQIQYRAAQAENNAAFFVFIAIVLVVCGAVYLLFKSLGALFNAITYEPPPPSPEEYDQHAAQLRAKSRLLAAEAEYEDNRAKAALKKHEANEVDEFVRGLRTKHGRR